MSRPRPLSTSGVSVSGVATMDHYRTPFSVSVNTVVTGTATYTLQFTSDDVYTVGFDPATANWKPHPSMTDLTVSSFVVFTEPVMAIRLNQTVGTGSVNAVVIQAGLGC